jgi:hypothetical protein
VTWLALDPANPQRAYASVAHSASGGIYVTNNLGSGAGSTWVPLAAPPRTERHPYVVAVLADGAIVASYSGRRAPGFTPSSGVFYKADAAAPWQDRSAPGLMYWTKDVVIDPHDATQNTWYAAVFSGWGGAANGLGGLYRTTDRGVHWTRISDRDRVESITVSPTDPDFAWLTTEMEGLWYTTDLRAATPTFTRDATFPFRQPMRVFYNPHDNAEIWVGSFGGGLRVGRVSTDRIYVDGFEGGAQ